MSFTILKESMRMHKRARRIAAQGFPAYDGTPEQICEKIITSTYDKRKRYLMVSSGHFCEFYVRDFAYTCEALVSLGHKHEVRSTLQFALNTFRKAGKVTTSISPDGVAFDFPCYGPDSLAMLLYAITHTGNDDLVTEDKAMREFLQAQAAFFARYVIDPKSLLPRKRDFSSIRDHARRDSSCYDAVMAAVVARECRRLHMTFPYDEVAMTPRIIEEYWNGTYFFEDRKKQGIVVGDANVYPFWTGIIRDSGMLESAVTAMRAAGLDRPFPLRYVSSADKDREDIGLHIANLFAGDYETDSIWIHLGLCYLRIVAAMDKELLAQYLGQYEALIVKHRNFLEVYDARGAPFTTRWYVADDSLVWCANWLALNRHLVKGQIASWR